MKQKQIKQIVLPFSVSLVIASFTMLLTILFATFAMFTTTVYASGHQTEWFSSSGAPSVKVYVRGAFVYAKVSKRNLNLAATKLKYVNGRLLNEYDADYIQIKDYNGDGFSDIGVLTSVGYGGSDQCYAVFEYAPDYYGYKTRSRKTVCAK